MTACPPLPRAAWFVSLCLTLLAVTAPAGDAPPADTAIATDGRRQVVITPAAFSAIYPAVWLDLATGDITPLREETEEPPEKRYEVWIEPGDPEFRIWPEGKADDRRGFAYVGDGQATFDQPPALLALTMTDRLHDLMERRDVANQPVFLCRGSAGECLIMVTAYDKEHETIRLLWRPLPRRAAD